MNLHGIVAGFIGAVNPLVAITIQRSTGYTVTSDGTQVPKYAEPAVVFAQIQALSAEDLSQIDGLNIQGEKRAVYINGRSDGVIRQDRKGGDLITFNTLPSASFLGFITETQLLIDQVFYGTVQVGQTVSGVDVLSNTVITDYGTGSGGAGSYVISPAQTAAGPEMKSVEIETWLNVHVLEYWPDWCKFIITRQDGQ